MERRKRSAYRRNLLEQGAWTAALLLLVLLVFFLANLFARDRAYSEAENRNLAQKPEFSLSALADGSYFADWSDYLADQFVGRDFWVSLDLQRARLFGAKEAGGVLLCDDGYLMEEPAAPDEAALANTLSAVNAFAARHGDLRVSMSVVPNAACVLSDKLPANAPVRDQRQDLGAIADSLRGVEFLDVTDALLAHRDEPIYYRTDHHWTSLGASYAFAEMAPGLGISEPAADWERYTVSNDFEGTLASKSGCHEVLDAIEIYVPKTGVTYTVRTEGETELRHTIYDAASLDGKDQYAVFLGGNDARVDIETTADTGRTLLLCKDSYANCFLQFLLPYYDHIILIDPRYYYGDADTLIAREKVTDVLFLYNANTFLTDRSLAEVLAE